VNGTVVLFDVDHTLVGKNCLWAIGRALVREGIVPRSKIAAMGIEHLLYKLRRRSLPETLRRAYGMIEGCDIQRVESVVERVVREVLEPALYGEAVARISMHQARGDRVVLASATPALVVERIGMRVGVTEVIATQYERAGSRFGRVLEPQACGAGKVELARREGLFSSGRPHVYTDHAEDLALVLASGFATLVNPANKLVKEVRRHNIPHETVRWSRFVGAHPESK
jgi:HAD superfamily hydrolase (TIGR01490 family)